MKHAATWNKWDVLVLKDDLLEWDGRIMLEKGAEVVAMSGIIRGNIYNRIMVIPFEIWSKLNELLPNEIATDDFYYDMSEDVPPSSFVYKTTITTGDES